MGVVNIKKLIDVSTGLPVIPLARRDFSNTIIIQTGAGYTTGDVRSYMSAGDIASDLGSNSQAYKFALKFFAGGFNGIKPKKLYVGLANKNDVVASTQGFFTTGEVDTHLTAFQAVDNGEFKIAVDGAEAIEITELDLTSATSLENVAELIDYAISNVAGIKNIKVSYDSTAKSFIFKSNSYGSTSNVVISSIAGGTGDDLTGATLFNGGTSTIGTDGTQATTIQTFLNNYSYYHICLDLTFTETQAKEWSSAVESASLYDYMLWIQTATSEVKTASILTDTGTIALDFFNRKKNKTVLTYTDNLTDYTSASLVSYFAQVQFNIASQLGTASNKPFTDAVAITGTDAQLNQYFDNLTAKNVNFYATYNEAGRSIAKKGKVSSGQSIETIILADWINYNMTMNIYDWLIGKDKVRYTTSDFAELRTQIELTLITAKGFGAIVSGNDPQTGEQYINGYKITIPNPSDISQADKSQGLLSGISVIALTSEHIDKIVINNTLKI